MEHSFKNSLRKYVTWMLYLGRIIGVIPHTGIQHWHQQGNLQYRMLSTPRLHSIALLTYFLLLTSNLVYLLFIRFSDTGSVFDSRQELLAFASYELSVFLVYLYFFSTAHQLTSLLTVWHEVTEILANTFSNNEPSLQPKRFKTKRDLIAPLLLLAVAVIEGFVYDIRSILSQSADGIIFPQNDSILKLYFRDGGQFLARYIPYHPVFGIIFFILEKSGVLAWSYGDVFVIVLCNISACQLKLFRDYIASEIHSSGEMGGVHWEHIRCIFVHLCNTLQKVADYVTPLVLICYGRNIYEMTVNVFLVLNGSLQRRNYAAVSVTVFQLTLRVVLVTYYASEVHTSFHRITKEIEACPTQLYDVSTRRLERYIDTQTLGVHLFGTFCITRKFFVSIISFIFTTEIILLQSMAVSNCSCTETK